MNEAFAQLPEDDECWVAFHWSNGAPMDAIPPSLQELDLPKNLVGLLFVGSAVAFPHAEIHNFASWIRVEHNPFGERAFHSAVDSELARLVHARIDNSSGVRASVVRTGMGSKAHDMLVRDGSRRILPFILLIDPDPNPATHVTVPLPG